MDFTALSHVSVRQLLDGFDGEPRWSGLVSVPKTTPVSSVLSLLSSADIISAPLTESDEDGNDVFVGTVDVLDLCGALLRSDLERHVLEGGASGSHAFLSQPIGEVSGLANTGHVHCSMQTSVADLLTMLTRAPRAVVVGDRGQPEAVVSQMRVLKMFHRHPEAMGPLLQRPLSSAVSASEVELVSVTEGTSALEAFKELFLADHPNIFGAPVVDQAGSIVDVVSASDLRGLTATNFSSLALPIKRYLAQRQGRPRGPVTCPESQTLGHVVDLMVTHDVHRVFVCSDKDFPSRPTSVVTVSDIINEVKAWRDTGAPMKRAVHTVFTLKRAADAFAKV
jgi:CBS domain-containing protein